MLAEDDQLRHAETRWLEAWKAGPTRLRWTGLPVQVGDPAPDMMLSGSDGNRIRLSTLWSDGPALIVFLRHFGCSCAFDRARKLTEDFTALQEAGANVIAIGQAEPARAAAFASQRGLPCPLLCDPERVAYEAFGLLEGRPAQVVYGMPDDFLRHDPDIGAEFQRSRHGTERAAVDNPWQLPGDFVIGRDGILRLTFRAQYCDDYPDRLLLLAAIREAVLGL